jgi:hypothetical protein
VIVIHISKCLVLRPPHAEQFLIDFGRFGIGNRVFRVDARGHRQANAGKYKRGKQSKRFHRDNSEKNVANVIKTCDATSAVMHCETASGFPIFTHTALKGCLRTPLAFLAPTD